MDTQSDLRRAVIHIRDEVEAGDFNAGDWLAGVLDVNYIIHADRSYRGAILVTACGGPDVWINTANKCIEGQWGSDTYSTTYIDDPAGLDEATEEIYIAGV